MAKSCAGCGYYSAAPDETACPTCARALQTTFLPPPGSDTGPAVKWGPPLATPQTARYATYGPGQSFGGLGALFRNRFLFGLVAAPVLLCLRLAFGVGGGTDVQQRYDKVKTGMTVAQVETILYGDTRFHHPTRRSRQFNANGVGTMVYENGGLKLVVTFLNGRAVNQHIYDEDDSDEEP